MLAKPLNLEFKNFDNISEFVEDIDDIRTVNALKTQRLLDSSNNLENSRQLLSKLVSGNHDIDLSFFWVIESWWYVLQNDQELTINEENNTGLDDGKETIEWLRWIISDLEMTLISLGIYDIFIKSDDVLEELYYFFTKWPKIIPESLMDKKIVDFLEIKPGLHKMKEILDLSLEVEEIQKADLSSLDPDLEQLKEFFWIEDLRTFLTSLNKNEWRAFINIMVIIFDYYKGVDRDVYFREIFDGKCLSLQNDLKLALNHLYDKYKTIDKTYFEKLEKEHFENMYEEVKFLLKEQQDVYTKDDIEYFDLQFEYLFSKISYDSAGKIRFLNYIIEKKEIDLLILLFHKFIEKKQLSLDELDLSKTDFFKTILEHYKVVDSSSIEKKLDNALALWDDLDLTLIYLIKTKYSYIDMLREKDLQVLFKYILKNRTNKNLIEFIKQTPFQIDEKIPKIKKKWVYCVKISKKFIPIRNYEDFLSVNKRVKMEYKKDMIYRLALWYDEDKQSFCIDVIIWNLVFEDWLQSTWKWYNFDQLIRFVWYSNYFMDFHDRKHTGKISVYDNKIVWDTLQLKEKQEKKEVFTEIKDALNHLEKTKKTDKVEIKQAIINLRSVIMSIVSESVARTINPSIYDNESPVIKSWTKIDVTKKSRLYNDYKNDSQKTQEKLIYLATWKKWINIDALLEKYDVDNSEEESVDTILAKNNLKVEYLPIDLVLWLDKEKIETVNRWKKTQAENSKETNWYDSFPKYDLLIKELQTLGYVWNIVNILETDSFYNVIVLELDWEFKTIFVSDNYWNATYVVDTYISKSDIQDSEWDIIKIIKDRKIEYKSINFSSNNGKDIESWKKRIIEALWLSLDKKQQEELQLKSDDALFNILSWESILAQIKTMETKSFPIKWKEFAKTYNKDKQKQYEKIDENYNTVIRRLWWNAYISYYKNSSLFIKEYMLALLRKEFDIVEKIEFNLVLNHEPTVNKDKVKDFVSKVKSWSIKLKDRSDLKVVKGTKDLLLDSSIEIPYWVTTVISLLILVWWNPNVSTSLDYLYAILNWNTELIRYFERK